MIKNHIFLMLALIALLVSYQSVVTFERLSYDYEQKLSSSYAIVLISKSAINYEKLNDEVPAVKSVEQIAKENVIKSIKDNLTRDNIQELFEELPLFYRIHLKAMPTKNELYNIEYKLKNMSQVIKVEAFTAAQNKIAAFMEIVENILVVFSILFLFISTLLIAKQISVWRYMHQKRMQIMAILGAKMWFRSKKLYIMALVDSFASTILIAAFFTFIARFAPLVEKIESLGLVSLRYEPLNDSLFLFVIALFISAGSVTYVVLKSEKELE